MTTRLVGIENNPAYLEVHPGHDRLPGGVAGPGRSNARSRHLPTVTRANPLPRHGPRRPPLDQHLCAGLRHRPANQECREPQSSYQAVTRSTF